MTLYEILIPKSTKSYPQQKLMKKLVKSCLTQLCLSLYKLPAHDVKIENIACYVKNLKPIAAIKAEGEESSSPSESKRRN